MILIIFYWFFIVILRGGIDIEVKVFIYILFFIGFSYLFLVDYLIIGFLDFLFFNY